MDVPLSDRVIILTGTLIFDLTIKAENTLKTKNLRLNQANAFLDYTLM